MWEDEAGRYKRKTYLGYQGSMKSVGQRSKTLCVKHICNPSSYVEVGESELELRSLSCVCVCGGGCTSVVATLLILCEALGPVMKWGEGRRNSKASHAVPLDDSPA